MIKFSNTAVMNFEGALRGMRNPLESWDKSDSEYFNTHASGYNMGETASVCDRPLHTVGDKDYKLAMTLGLAGNDHGKFLRQIGICVDITAPLYWWKEFDTYKVGTVANSTSTMHKLGSRHLTPEDFSWDYDNGEVIMTASRQDMLIRLNFDIDTWKDFINKAKNTSDLDNKAYYNKCAKRVWRRLIQDLPSSFNQTRTVTLNYQVARTIFQSDRKNHKQVEWKIGFMDWLKTLPLQELITTRTKTPQEKKLIQALDDIYAEVTLYKNKIDSDIFDKIKAIAEGAMMD